MTLDSQQRLCRAGIIIGALFCVAAVFEVTIGLMGLFTSFTTAGDEDLQDPEGISAVVAEVIITMIVRLWPLPIAVLFLVPSLIWRHRLRRFHSERARHMAS
jgi:hypothetical protein